MFGALAVDEVVAARGELAGREAGLRLSGAGLAHLVGTHAHERVVVVEGRGVAHEVQRRRVVEGVDVARVLAHVGALDVEVLEVVEGHDHDVGVHLHHERDEALLAHVVGQHARVRLSVGKDLVVGVAGDVVDAHVRVGEKPLDGAAEVLPKAAALGVEHEVLAHDGEEAPVVLALAAGVGVGPPPGTLAGGEGVELGELGLGRLELPVVNVLGGLDAQVADGLHGDGEQVRANPVERHARRDVDAQEERQGDGQAVRGVLLGAGLLALQRVDVVGGHAHHDRRERGGHGHDPRGPAVLHGHEAEELGAGGPRVGDGVDDVHEAEQDDDLDGKRDEREQRVVVVLVVELALALADLLLVAEVLDLDAVERRHHAHHDDGVPLAPKRQRHEHHLGDEREQEDGGPPVVRKLVARPHDGHEDVGDPGEHGAAP